ncbi:MAG: hypothetical protein P4L77_11725 [Sulfuriferula sp.]|nr:hypothetical protein [Sulfuriferula sp.]
MNIKDFQRESKRPQERTVFERILADLSMRGPLPPIGQGFTLLKDVIHHNEKKYNTLALPDDEGWIWHVCVMDLNRPDGLIFLMETRTKDGEFGFQSFKLFKPEHAPYISFDIVQFFYERVGLHKGKPLEVEKMLKTVYNDLPETYTMKLNIKSREKDDAPIIQWHKTPPKESSNVEGSSEPVGPGSDPVHSGTPEDTAPAGGTVGDCAEGGASTSESAGGDHTERAVPEERPAGEQDAGRDA